MLLTNINGSITNLLGIALGITILTLGISAKSLAIGQYNYLNNDIGSSITFITAKDTSSTNRFYEMASQFFSINPNYHTEVLVDHLHSLEEIVQYLNQHQPPQGDYWSTVNIVSHSSQFGLNLPIARNSGPLNTKTIQEYNLKYRKLFPERIQYLSKNSLVTLWGCSYGKRLNDLAFIKSILHGRDGEVSLRSPEKRLFFKQDYASMKIEHFYAEEYPVYLKHKIRSRSDLINRFEEKYPNVNMNWTSAISQEYLQNESKEFYQSTKFRVRFYVDRSLLLNYQTLNEFVLSQPEILDILAGLEVPIEELNFTAEANPDSNLITISARSTLISVLKKSNAADTDVMAYALSQ